MARILVVDDDPDILKMVEKVLRLMDHDVVVANDAIQAMDCLNTSPFDLLLSDANMPHFSGFELVNTIRNNKKFKDMAIAMLTGLRERKDIEKAIRAGVEGYIVKPIEPNLFVQKIEDIFEKKPPVSRKEFHFPQSSDVSMASAVIPIQLVSLSDSSLTVRTGVPFEEGSLVEIATSLFTDMGMPQTPALKVLSQKTYGDGEYEIELGFYGMTENIRDGIRKWIEKQNHSDFYEDAA